ncbi:energy transducer TonB [Rhizorhabdus phycosphaerae]|uniref:energy transducer TonB n=1 Tax=Rhizorhabdus phycosphaerae TaxID=2711156 RepID=UPI0013ECB390|nr:energy transducer TonB [Rhizorhabdus phycosphaerae]
MTNGGYLTERKSRPLGLGLVIAGHAAVLAALILAPPESFTRIVYLPTVVESIEAPPPPTREVPPPPKASPKETQPQKVAPLVDLSAIARPVQLEPLPQVEPTLPQQLPSSLPAAPVFVAATIDPGVAARFQPGYPSALARADIEGSATVRVLIGTDGRVKQVELVNATHAGFFEATRDHALRAWRFRPATRDGVPTESWRTMTVRFKLES